jgi:hypothetical protein
MNYSVKISEDLFEKFTNIFHNLNIENNTIKASILNRYLFYTLMKN